MLANLVCNTSNCYFYRLLAQKSSEVLDEIENPTLQSKLKVRGTTLVCMVNWKKVVHDYFKELLLSVSFYII